MGLDRIGQERIGKDRKVQDRIGTDRNGQERIGLDRLGQDRIGQDRIGQDRIGQDWKGQDSIGQDRIGQERIGQDQIGLDRISLVRYISLHQIVLFLSQARYLSELFLTRALSFPFRCTLFMKNVAVACKIFFYYLTFTKNYSQTCIQPPPLGPPKSGCCTQVVALQRFFNQKWYQCQAGWTQSGCC